MAIIKKVWLNKSNGQKLVTIPKDSTIKAGDEIIIQDLNEFYGKNRGCQLGVPNEILENGRGAIKNGKDVSDI